jgi:predicted RNase H-like nuclease (RuvC/YqgF family)
VGIDAGTTTAIAALDLNGNLVEIKSSKELGLERTIAIIRKIGTPVMFSCDVKVPPVIVEKISSKFNAKLVYPDHDLGVAEKRILLHDFFGKHGFEYKIENSHEHDAYVAAIYAFNQHQKLFQKIEKILYERGEENRIDEIKAKIITGEFGCIEDALKEESVEEKEGKKREHMLGIESEKSKLQKDIHVLRSIIDELKKENYILKDKNEYLQRQLLKCGPEELHRIAEMRKATIESLERKVIALEEEVAQLKTSLNKCYNKIDDEKLERMIDKHRKRKLKVQL